jgi:hypothetical protein
MRAFILALLPLTAFAQHEHHGLPAKTVETTMPDGRKAVSVPKAGETVEDSQQYAIPLGNGPSPNGECWLLIMETGQYRILNASINKDKSANPMLLVAGQIYRIGAHPGPLVWVKPGKTANEEVPKQNQIAIDPSHAYKVQD